MNTAHILKVLEWVVAGLLCELTIAAPAGAAPSLTGLEREIAQVNATYVHEHPNDWGQKADAMVAARLLTTQRAWQRYRDLRCHTLAGVHRAGQGAACLLSQTQLRLAELTNVPDAQLEAAMSKANLVCQDGAAVDQMLCYSDYSAKREARVTAFIAGYGRSHGQPASRALDAVYTQWKVYANGACFRDDYDSAPMHPSSQQAAWAHCLLLLNVADLSFIDGWQ